MDAELIRLISEIWEQNPNLRLCQLIGNCFGENDLYYKEDNDLIKQLKNTYLIGE